MNSPHPPPLPPLAPPLLVLPPLSGAAPPKHNSALAPDLAPNLAPITAPTLTIRALSKRFGGAFGQGVAALTDISLAVAPGERVALLGHNGAGKSTLMKIILGLIPATSGEVTVCGAAPGAPAARAQVAYLPENVAFHPALTGTEHLRHYLRLRGQDPSQAASLLARVGLGAAANRRLGTYSKGMRQRVGLAQTLIGTPRLLVLDEPASGLDPVSRRDFYDLLDGLAATGTAILLSSHALTEVEARTDRIVILSQGRMVASGSLSQLRSMADLPVAVHLKAAPGHAAAIAKALPQARCTGQDLHLTCRADEKLPLMARIAALGDTLADAEFLPPSLEDIYSHFSKRDGQ